ncbi:hypothetical protein EIP86_001301 [Pleurotus ostreatoroseus]|nr:hypothetical protein EIP86_001301 [Pleurotus ostreatoroseus]
MKALYPNSDDPSKLSESALALKIARHSPCSICTADICPGLRPPPIVQLVLDSVEDYDGSESYLSSCSCGHDAIDHGADLSEINQNEFARRGRVAIRIDELLKDVGRLLDFDYVDGDIESLRRQMTLPEQPGSPLSETIASLVADSPKPSDSQDSSFLSDAFDGDPEPPTKRRRVSFSESSLSSESSSSSGEEEDRPLAAKRAERAGKERGGRKHNGKGKKGNAPRARGQRTAGKTMSSMKSKAQSAPTSKIAQSESRSEASKKSPRETNGRDHGVKIEDKMDESQITRLATGVTVDAGVATATTPGVKPEKPSHIELRKGIIQIVPVENDSQPRSLVILTGLKTLFQKQLPKMPREYIARLVFDSNSKCLAIIKRGYKVVGGICYRPFPHRGFAEIVFFATASVDQVKGYGGMLMDHFKAHIRKTYPEMWHFLTYADNYAVGYFRKQGFSKEITLPRSVWAGYIKDYEGGTIMQCKMLPKVDYIHAKDIISAQREAIYEKIREKSRSHIVYSGIENWKDSGEPLDPKDIPGLRESGWTPSMAAIMIKHNGKSAEHSAMEKLLSDLQGHPLAWAFLQPVNVEEVQDYLDVVKQPMDFHTMEHKLDHNQYPNLDTFLTDAQLVFDNCRTYNAEGSLYHKNATKLERYLKEQVASLKLKKDY